MSINPSLVCTGKTYWNSCWNYCVSCTGTWNITGCACQGSSASMSYSSYTGVTTLTEIPVLNYSVTDTTVPSTITALPNYEYFPPEIIFTSVASSCYKKNSVTGVSTLPAYLIYGGASNIKYNIQANGIDSNNNSTFFYNKLLVSPNTSLNVLTGLNFITNTAAVGGNYQYETEALNVSATYVDPTYGYTFPMGYNLPLSITTWLPDCTQNGTGLMSSYTGGFSIAASSGVCLGPGGCTYTGNFSFGGSGDKGKLYNINLTANYSNGTTASIGYPLAPPSVYNFAVYTANNIYDQNNNLYVTGNPPKVQLTLYYVNNSNSNDNGYLVTGITLPICQGNPYATTGTSTSNVACSYGCGAVSGSYYYLNKTTFESLNFTKGYITGYSNGSINYYINITGKYEFKQADTYTPNGNYCPPVSSTYSGTSNFSGDFINVGSDGNGGIIPGGILNTTVCNSKIKNGTLTWTGTIFTYTYDGNQTLISSGSSSIPSNGPSSGPCNPCIHGVNLCSYVDIGGTSHNQFPNNFTTLNVPTTFTYTNQCPCLCPPHYTASAGQCVYVG